MTRVRALRTDVERCPRCGKAHMDLPVAALDPRGPGKLRGGETHDAVCPETGWAIFFVVGRTPEEGPTFKLMVKEVM
jgi:hypothetical protein